MNKKLIFDYLKIKPDWGCKRLEAGLNLECIKSKNPVLLHCLPDNEKPCIYYYERFRDLDGNDILEAVGIMEKKGDWEKFITFYCKHNNSFDLDGSTLLGQFMLYFYKNFFELLSDWLEVRK